MFNEFQQRLAALGFTSTPISEGQFYLLLAAGFDEESALDVASDVASGYTLREAVEAHGG